MAQIYRHPDLQDYFVTVDFADPAAYSNVVRHYESGKAILLTNVQTECDNELISKTAFVPQESFKKFKSISFLNDHLSGRDRAHPLRSALGGDDGKYRAFVEQIRSVNAQLEGICRRLFPNYRVLKPSITWRLTDTVNENLHIDVYNQDIPDHHLRLFVNLDIVPRIWHTSFTLPTMLDQYLGMLDSDFVRNASPGRICHDLNFAVFGGFETAGREGKPKHIAFFEPNEIWLVDSRKVSHQIFYGRRAASTEFAIDVSSMEDPLQHYYAVVDRFRARHLGSASGVQA
jgi:hypothetical protein